MNNHYQECMYIDYYINDKIHISMVIYMIIDIIINEICCYIEYD